MKTLACLFLLLLCACTPMADPYTMSAYADGAISATEIAVVERAQIATLDAALAQSSLIVQQTQSAMNATATSQEQAAQSTMVAAQHTAVMDALRATQDRYVAGLQQDARINEEFARQTQSALVATATQGALVSATTRTSAMTDAFVYLLWSASCLSSLAVLAVILLKWYRSMKEIERLVYQPRIPAMPMMTTGSELQANIQATQPEDERYADLAKIILQSAYRNGWNSNEIAGHRDLDMGGGKWHRLISLISDHVERDREGTRIIDGTLREFYAEMQAGRIRIG